MDIGIPHTIVEWVIVAMLGGGGAWKAYDLRQSKHGTDRNSTKLKGLLQEANQPLLNELKGLCKISEKTYNELHTYIEIQKDRDRRGGRIG